MRELLVTTECVSHYSTWVYSIMLVVVVDWSHSWVELSAAPLLWKLAWHLLIPLNDKDLSLAKYSSYFNCKNQKILKCSSD